ncbi:hypothetical protein CQW23_09817 [Capsicum baccatum]|uniref:Dephospho-CoA kinase n=1 Tax=Capsicum baccatum TaxID=33114 RepID=A0A2G2WXZ2_CAPBA|nr:hypothetical protein CQW23_09817 [Capsicum baccatum]
MNPGSMRPPCESHFEVTKSSSPALHFHILDFFLVVRLDYPKMLLAPRSILMEVLKLWIQGCSIIVLDVPLLFEDKMDKWTKPIVVIWFDPETQLQRLMTRDGSMEEAKSRINAQMSLDLKRSKADIVIDNTSSLEVLHEQFQKVLTEITKPLTCIEFMLSRNGAFLALFSTFVSVAIFKKSS